MKISIGVYMIAAGLMLPRAVLPQDGSNHWDIAVWVAGSTGEELTNSFAEAQLVSAGVYVGRTLTSQIGQGWRRGRLEYGFDVFPVFQLRPAALCGAGLEPVIFRWNSSVRLGRTRPYIELAGGALRTTGNLPSGDTSSFNFTAKGGGGFYIPVHDYVVDVGVRWSHISNANLGTRNPEFNGIEVKIGYHWTK